MKSVALSALVLLLFALPLAGLVAGYAHALGAGPLAEAATFGVIAVLLLFTGIKANDAVGSSEKSPPMPRKG